MPRSFRVAIAALLAIAIALSPLGESFASAQGDEVRAGPKSRLGMVSGTTGAKAVEGGVGILKQGGTAADAALATAMGQVCLAAGSWVSYAGLMTMVYYEASSGKVYNMNAAFNTVKGETDPLTIPGIKLTDLKGFDSFTYPPSGRTALVPGFMAGVEAAHQRFGKLPLRAVFQSAIDCAENGIEWAAGNAQQYAFREKVLGRLPQTKAVFAKADGSAPKVGETFKQPALAATLRKASDGIGSYMYRGEWAKELVAAVQRDGGKMTLEDLAAYEVQWSEPAKSSYHGYDIHAHGLPASGGVHLLEAMNLAELGKLERMEHYSKSPLMLYWLAQIAKPSFLLSPAAMAADPTAAERIRQLGLDMPLSARADKRAAERLWKAIQEGQLPGIKPPELRSAHSDGVVVVDRWGNIAALVHSINTLTWGATGIFVGGVSIPDAAAFQQGAIAEIPPGSRLADQTNPGLVTRNGKPYMGFAAIGPGLHIRSIAALIGVLDFNLTPQEAINRPGLGMFDFANQSRLTVGAKEFAPAYLEELKALGQDVVENDQMRGYWVGVQIDQETGELHGGSIRELELGGRAIGY
jgi:gamma-glutamyltranspeptidase / glutathione hydrolase